MGLESTLSLLHLEDARRGIWELPRSRRLLALAQECGVTCDKKEIERARGALREEVEALRRAGFGDAEQTFLLEAEVLQAKLRDALATVDAVQEVFLADLRWFETIEVAGVAFDEAGEAEALCEALRSGRATFPVKPPPQTEILEEPALSGYPATSGYLGLVTRADLPPEVAEALFTDGVGEIVGPVPYAGRYWVYRVLLPKRAELNTAVYAFCADRVLELAFSR